jgi:hypothetical protein
LYLTLQSLYSDVLKFQTNSWLTQSVRIRTQLFQAKMGGKNYFNAKTDTNMFFYTQSAPILQISGRNSKKNFYCFNGLILSYKPMMPLLRPIDNRLCKSTNFCRLIKLSPIMPNFGHKRWPPPPPLTSWCREYNTHRLQLSRTVIEQIKPSRNTKKSRGHPGILGLILYVYLFLWESRWRQLDMSEILWESVPEWGVKVREFLVTSEHDLFWGGLKF